jgi:hypothetical protein
MRLSTLTTILASSVLAANVSHAALFKIGGFIFDEANTARTASIAEGPVTLPDASNKEFGRYSEEYVSSPDTRINEFARFGRNKSLACLMGRPQKGEFARHISFAEPGALTAVANVHRSTIEVTWGEFGLPNKVGADFVIYESGSWEGFAVSVRKVGSPEFTRARYQFANATDKIHNANAVAFDLSDFGFAENEVVAAVRIRNLFNSQSRIGADKVDNQSGEGNVIVPGEPQYKTAFTLSKAKGSNEEFKNEDLGADIVYVAGMHDIVPLKTNATKEPAPEAASAK